MQSHLQQLARAKRARLVTFFRNGDRFDRGLRYALSPEKVRSFEALLEDLTRVMVDLPRGVRYIYTADGRVQVSQLEQLREGCMYVCSSENCFVQLPYGRQPPPRPVWNMGSSTRGIAGAMSTADTSHLPSSQRAFMRPKLITVIKKGQSPEMTVEVHLNQKKIQSFENILDDIKSMLKLDSGALLRIYTSKLKLVTTLADLFGSETVFIAYGGAEKGFKNNDSRDNEQCEPFKGSSPVRTEPRYFSSPPMSPISYASSELSFQRSHFKSNRKPSNLHHVKIPETVTRLYQVREMLGDGTFARVYHCICRSSSEEYALKIIDKNKCKNNEELLAREVAILKKVKHPNIVRLVEEFDVESELYLVMELAKGGDLHDAIAAERKFPEREASRMVRDLASALSYLRVLRVVHRDIKPENLLLGFGGMLKLADFGLATELPADGSLLLSMCGTPEFIAPEMLTETGYGLEVDVWAMGVLTYILLCGFAPFGRQTDNQEELFYQILLGQFEFPSPDWDDVSASARKLIKGMLQLDVVQRLSAVEVLLHPWIHQQGSVAGWSHFPPEGWKMILHCQKRRRSSPESSVTLSMATNLWDHFNLVAYTQLTLEMSFRKEGDQD